MAFISKVDFEPRRLLNRSEYGILRILENITREIGGGYRVMAQTSLGEIIAPAATLGSKEARDLAFRSINGKRLDFLVIDRIGMPALAVEYQGHGHDRNGAFMRDAVKREAVRKAGIQLLEVPAEYDAQLVENQIGSVLRPTVDAPALGAVCGLSGPAFTVRHPREACPRGSGERGSRRLWIPAFAGMTAWWGGGPLGSRLAG